MAIPTRDSIITDARSIALDADSANPVVSDTTARLWLIRYLQIYSSFFPSEFVAIVGAAPVSITVGSLSVSFNETVRQVRGLIRCSRASSNGPIMEKKSVNEIIELQNLEPTNGVPAKWAYLRGPGSGQTQEFTLYVHPIPDGTYSLIPWCEFEPADFSAGTDTSQLGVLAGHNLATMLAARIARASGRDETFVNGILSDLPEPLRSQMRTNSILLRPRETEGKSAT